MDAETSWIRCADGRLFARRWDAPGDRAPIVLFHDSLGCVAVWRDFPARLAEATQRPVIAYDRLGFGESDPHPRALQRDFVEAEAQEGFRALREQLGFDRFIAFGHSVGGGMAIATAAASPDACRALITESAQTFVEDRTLEGIRAAKIDFAKPGQVDRLRKYHGDKAEWVLHAWIDTWLAPGFRDWNLDASLRCIGCPVLAIHGTQDAFGSTAHPERIAALAPGPVVVDLMECGHVPHREREAAVLARVARWLEHAGD